MTVSLNSSMTESLTTRSTAPARAQPNDAHIHAAAKASGAALLLSADSGFTSLTDEIAEQLPYEAHTPDTFFLVVDWGVALALS